jgi:hypothetical protein
MSFKPSRSSGITFDKHKRNEEKYLNLRDSLINKGTISVKDIAAASKYIYLAAKNGSAAEGKDLAADLQYEYYLPSFAKRIFLMEKWQHLVHKPLLSIIK